MTNKDIEKMKNNIDELVENLKLKQEKTQDLASVNMQLQVERNELRQTVDDLRKQISALESELSVKENLLKIKNGLCGENDLNGLTPIEVANTLIEHKTHMESYLVLPERDVDTFSVSELRQIAEHLFVYCNHNSEEG